MKTVECYKFVIDEKSVIARGHHSLQTCHPDCACRYAVEYKIGEVTVPKIGKLYCFATLDQARDFSSDYGRIWGNLNIFKGIGTNPTSMKYTANYYSDIVIFWKNVQSKKSVQIMNVYLLPKGTICVDSFEPKELVE